MITFFRMKKLELLDKWCMEEATSPSKLALCIDAIFFLTRLELIRSADHNPIY